MKIHRLRHEEILPVELGKAWGFFAKPENLDDLMPPEMRFKIESIPEEKMYEGEIIAYRIRLAPLVWMRWVTEIKSVEEGECFIDEQRAGPYRFWHHLHRFEAVDGGTKVTDMVHYAVGWGIFGEIAHGIFVRRQLEKIFAFRREKMGELFGGKTD